jgi:hypothetical protein
MWNQGGQSKGDPVGEDLQGGHDRRNRAFRRLATRHLQIAPYQRAKIVKEGQMAAMLWWVSSRTAFLDVYTDSPHG